MRLKCMNREEELILIDKIKAGNDELYKLLIDSYSSKIISIVSGVVRDRSDAEEVAQDIFVKAFFSLKKFRGESSFSTWLYRIAYNMSISRVRKKRRYINVEDIGNFVSSDSMDGTYTDYNEEILNKEQRFRILENIVDELDPADRFLLLSFYLHEKSIRDISEITGISESNVKVKLHRIKKRMVADANELCTIYANNIE